MQLSLFGDDLIFAPIGSPKALNFISIEFYEFFRNLLGAIFFIMLGIEEGKNKGPVSVRNRRNKEKEIINKLIFH